MSAGDAIRRAGPADCARLTEVAHAAKRYWEYPEAWIREWRDVLTITPAYVGEHAVYLVEWEGVVAGFYALKGRGETVELDHLWIDPAFIGKGLGSRLLVHAKANACGDGVRRIETDSDPHAVGFYLRMGAERIGETPAPMEGAPERYLPRVALELTAAD